MIRSRWGGWEAACDVCGKEGPLNTNVPECMHTRMEGWEMKRITCRPPDPKHPARCPDCVKAGRARCVKRQPAEKPPQNPIILPEPPRTWKQAELFGAEA